MVEHALKIKDCQAKVVTKAVSKRSFKEDLKSAAFVSVW